MGASILSFATGQGTAGVVDLKTDTLTLSLGGTIQSISFGEGNSGIVRIIARESIDIRGTDAPIEQNLINLDEFAEALFIKNNLFSGGIISGVFPPVGRLKDLIPISQELKGDSGNVFIQTPSLSIADNGFLVVGNIGSGNGGQLEIEAKKILLRNSSLVADTSSGHGGNIFLNSDRLSLTESTITSTARQLGNGGNITINTNSLFLLNNSAITANAFAGNGGNILTDTPHFKM